jgi:hypothetical protein
MLAHVSKKIRKSKQKSRKLEKSERKPFWTLAVTSQCRITFSVSERRGLE